MTAETNDQVQTADAGKKPTPAPFKRIVMTIPHKELVAMTNFASTDATRHILNGVLIEISLASKTVVLVSTDGRRLGVLKADANIEQAENCAGDELLRAIIPIRLITISKPKFRGTSRVQPKVLLSVVFDNRTLVASPLHASYPRPPKITISDSSDDNAATSFSMPAINGNYPKYGQVIPAVGTPVGSPGICINPKLLEGFSKAVALLGDPHSNFVELVQHGDENKPITVWIGGPAIRTRFYGVLMPVRPDRAGGDSRTANPHDWLIKHCELSGKEVKQEEAP